MTNKAITYTLGRYGDLSTVERIRTGAHHTELPADFVEKSLEDFCRDFYLRAMALRKWNNRGEHAKSKGLELNVWHEIEEDETHVFYELYNEEGETLYQRLEKVS